MTLTRRSLLAGSAGLAAPAIARAQSASAGAGAIRIGEINSYTAMPAFTLPYRNGWQLAVEQVNAAGGVLGRKLEVISRDDAGRPQDAMRIAGELLNEQKVDLLAGGFLSNVGLAISDFALQNKRLYVAGEPLTDALVWEKGHRYCFRLRPSTYMQAAMLVEDAAKLPAKRWVTRGAELRVRHLDGEMVQAIAGAAPAGRDVRRRAVAGAGARSTPGRRWRRWRRPSRRRS